MASAAIATHNAIALRMSRLPARRKGGTLWDLGSVLRQHAVHAVDDKYLDHCALRTQPKSGSLERVHGGHHGRRVEASHVVSWSHEASSGWDGLGRPRSEGMRVTERFHRRDVGHIDLEMTFEDPRYYTRPFGFKTTLNLLPDDRLYEYVCTENQKFKDAAPN